MERGTARRGDGMSPAPIPRIEQNTHRAITIGIRPYHGKVGVAVAVEVSHRHGGRTGTGSVALGSLEGTVALAQQDTHCAVVGVGYGEVGGAIAIKITHRYVHDYRDESLWRGSTQARLRRNGLLWTAELHS